MIFDLGKVVFDYSFEAAVDSWAGAMGIGTDELRRRYVWDGTFERYERGEIGLPDVHENFMRHVGRDISFASFEKAWLGMFRDEIPGIREILFRLRPRFRLVALSNTNADHQRVWRELYREALEGFEKIFTSNEIGVRKPEAGAFGIVLDHLGLDPTEVLFIDDSPENVESAIGQGLRALRFLDAPRLEGELRRKGVWPA